MAVDIIDALVTYLAPVVGVPVVGQVPNPRPDAWVLLERTGGVAGLAADFPMISVDVWGPTKAGASDIAHTVWDQLVRRLPPVVDGIRIVRRIGVSGPTYQPQASSGGYRYRLAVQVKHQIIKETTP